MGVNVSPIPALAVELDRSSASSARPRRLTVPTCTAIFPARWTFNLLERFEDNLLFSCGIPIPVSLIENWQLSVLCQILIARFPALVRHEHAFTSPFLRTWMFDNKFFKTVQTALNIGLNGSRQWNIGFNFETAGLQRFGDRLKSSFHRDAIFWNSNRWNVGRGRSGFDFERSRIDRSSWPSGRPAGVNSFCATDPFCRWGFLLPRFRITVAMRISKLLSWGSQPVRHKSARNSDLCFGWKRRTLGFFCRRPARFFHLSLFFASTSSFCLHEQKGPYPGAHRLHRL